MLIKVNDDGSTIFPYNIKLLYADNPNTSLPKRPSVELLGLYGIFYVQNEYPASVKVTETDEQGRAVERIVLPANSEFDKPNPVLEGEVWKLKYSVIPEDANTIATRLYKSRVGKKAYIIKAFEKQFEAPVSALTFDWNPGYDSVLKLDAAKRLAEAASFADVTFFDFSNAPHVLTIAEATEVIMAIANHYSLEFTKKQQKSVQLVNATTLQEVKDILWE
jgi:hypothetical protein